MFTKAKVGTVDVLALAPLSILPEYQKENNGAWHNKFQFGSGKMAAFADWGQRKISLPLKNYLVGCMSYYFLLRLLNFLFEKFKWCQWGDLNNAI
mgnify:CR=1 FL=1